MPKSPILFVELVPKSCHFSNVRTTVTTKEWDKIRHISYEAADNKCEICGGTGKKQGYNHDLECHEIWEYNDETHTQRLAGLISLCPLCHLVKHVGRAIAMGKAAVAFTQLASVNGWNQEQIDEHVRASFEVYGERSKHQWKLDLSMLNEEPYSLKIKLGKKRIFEIKKFKKKRKRKARLKKKTGKRPARYK